VQSIERHAQLASREDPDAFETGEDSCAFSRSESLHSMENGQMAECATLVAPWLAARYWICSLSNNQWQVTQELGQNSWSRSSFYLALKSDTCRATVMVLDEAASPLKRAWCLFEVLQTFLRSKRDRGFHGLLLCTPTGVLNYQEGNSSVDASLAVAEQLAYLNMEHADATNKDDKEMIRHLVLSYQGGFDTMNAFIKRNIRSCLVQIQKHHNRQFKRLVEVLQERQASERGESFTPIQHTAAHSVSGRLSNASSGGRARTRTMSSQASLGNLAADSCSSGSEDSRTDSEESGSDSTAV